MDCNSYSYAPTMLDEKHRQIAYYENDDMYMELEQIGDVFCCSAYSWDGDLDVCEEFSALSKAAKLYEFIEQNYTDTPPGDELDEFIHNLIGEGRYA